jgi:hypothetical protein
MRPYFVAALIGFASFAVVAACNFELGDDTEGDMGNLRFSYSGNGCFFGCSLDKNALQGSLVTVSSPASPSTAAREHGGRDGRHDVGERRGCRRERDGAFSRA